MKHLEYLNSTYIDETKSQSEHYFNIIMGESAFPSLLLVANE